MHPHVVYSNGSFYSLFFPLTRKLLNDATIAASLTEDALCDERHQVIRAKTSVFVRPHENDNSAFSYTRLHSAEDCFRKPASLHWCPKLKHSLPVNRRIKQRENIWIRVDGALDRSLLIDVCPLNTNYKTCSVIKPSLKNEK